MLRLASGLTGLFALLPAIATAEIHYTVRANPEQETLTVRVEVPDARQGVKFQIPNWAPGSYRLVDNFRQVKDLKATDGGGRSLEIDTVMTETQKAYGDGEARRTANNAICTWSVEPADKVIIEYTLTSRVLDGTMHWAGPSTYIYIVDRIKEPCRLKVESPENWPAYVGLDSIGRSHTEFFAPDYDVLADNPVTMGNVLVDEYVSRGKTHTIVLRGQPKAEVDRTYLLKACQAVTEFQTDFFGAYAPYNKYVWHFNVTDSVDGAGGLEHLSSTTISLASGVGPGAFSVISHEFFHLWNVKRIRAKVLGPFDYTKLPETGTLWWMEGVTDYYAHLLPFRYKWTSEADFLADAASNIASIRRSAGLQLVSPHESSIRVGEASNGRGNSNGYQISYYTLGWVCGLLLDIELIDRTQGRHRLDDVTMALWEMTKDDQPGFEEDEIRKQLIRYGGAGMGKVYDDIIMTKGDKRIEDYLARAGLRLTQVRVPGVDFGFTAPANAQNGMIIQRLTRPSEAVKSGDKIVMFGGEKIEGSRRRQMEAFERARAKAQPGVAIPVRVIRGDQTLDAQIVPEFASRVVTRVEKIAFVNDRQRLVRDALLMQKDY